MKPTMDQILNILPVVAEHLPKWASVTEESFNVTNNKAHRIMFDTMRNLIRSKKTL